jgi:hypothetical protein
MSREAFDATREFLRKYANILTQTHDARLGYALDSRYCGITDYNSYLPARSSGVPMRNAQSFREGTDRVNGLCSGSCGVGKGGGRT